MSSRLPNLIIGGLQKVGNTSLSVYKTNIASGKFIDFHILKSENKIYTLYQIQLFQMLQQHKFNQLFSWLILSKNKIKEMLTVAHH